MDWPTDLTVTSSSHTHGPHDPDYTVEMLSDQDMLSNRSLAVEGWVATSGGRQWYVDLALIETRQACGTGSVPMAPGYESAGDGPVARHYRFDGLVVRLGQ